MIVNIIEASERLESAIKRIKDRCNALDSYNAEYANLIDIKNDLDRVELYLEDVKMEYLMDEATGIKKQTCLRCGYDFVPSPERAPNVPYMIVGMKLPKTCPNPKCKSPYWNKPRTKGVVVSAEPKSTSSD